MADLDSLVQRYVEDRSSLSPRELNELIVALRADPELAVTLRDQLLLDDLLAQKLTLDRRNFVAQVEQRIADFQRGHEELSQQVADLRSMAAAERDSTAASARIWRWSRFALALSVLPLIGLAIYVSRSLTPHPPSIAKITASEGDATIRQNGDSEPAEVGHAVEGGQQIVVPRGGSISLAYQGWHRNSREGRFVHHVWRRTAGRG
jgi:hypothetical protein